MKQSLLTQRQQQAPRTDIPAIITAPNVKKSSLRELLSPHKGHTFGQYVYNDDATVYSNGTKAAKCLFCEETNTVEAENTQIETTVTFLC